MKKILSVTLATIFLLAFFQYSPSNVFADKGDDNPCIITANKSSSGAVTSFALTNLDPNLKYYVILYNAPNDAGATAPPAFNQSIITDQTSTQNYLPDSTIASGTYTYVDVFGYKKSQTITSVNDLEIMGSEDRCFYNLLEEDAQPFEFLNENTPPPPTIPPESDFCAATPIQGGDDTIDIDQAVSFSSSITCPDERQLSIQALLIKSCEGTSGDYDGSQIKDISNDAIENTLTFHEEGIWQLVVFDRTRTERIESSVIEINVGNVSEETSCTQTNTCAVCSREEGFFYYDQPNNRCCKYYGCTLSEELTDTIDQINQMAAAQESPAKIAQLYSTYKAKEIDYIKPPNEKPCKGNEFCLPGKGCSPDYPDPGKPPCAEGAFEEATGKCYTVQTAVAFVDTDPAGLVRSLLGILLSISGMIALYFIIRSGYQLMTSRGNPETIQAAKERLTSAIVGLLFILFSLVILQVIGVDLLKIPGFGE